MKKSIIIAFLCALTLSACTEKVVLVTTPVNLSVRIDEIKGTKAIFTITVDNPDAYYSYCLWNDPNVSNEGLMDYILTASREDYKIKTENEALKIATYVDYNCYRGTRTLRATRLNPDTEYKFIVFQINPKTGEPIGDIISQTIKTKPVKMEPLDFRFDIRGKTITVIPSDQNRSYYWEYDNLTLMYDNFNWAFGWYLNVVDMYEHYGFMENLLSKGTEVYDASRDSFDEGEICTIVAAAYEDGEITSEYKEFDFICEKGQLFPYASNDNNPEGN